MTSRIRGFHRLPLVERRRALATAVGLPPADLHALAADGLPAELADGMIENAVGTFSLPFGVAAGSLGAKRPSGIPAEGTPLTCRPISWRCLRS